MKLLKNFDESFMSEKLLELIIHRLSEKAERNPKCLAPVSIMQSLKFDYGVVEINQSWNIRHQQMAIVKSLKILAKKGYIDIISLTTTKLTLGLIHIKSGQVFKLPFEPEFISEFGSLIRPKYSLKYGEWASNS